MNSKETFSRDAAHTIDLNLNSLTPDSKTYES